MSKKKNTLKDLDEFLKQEAATLSQPTSLREKIVTKQETPLSKENTPISEAEIINQLQALLKLHQGSKIPLYNIIISTLEQQQSATSPEDMMLINTALYLKHGNAWKEEIQKYWKEKS